MKTVVSGLLNPGTPFTLWPDAEPPRAAAETCREQALECVSAFSWAKKVENSRWRRMYWAALIHLKVSTNTVRYLVGWVDPGRTQSRSIPPLLSRRGEGTLATQTRYSWGNCPWTC